MSDQSQSASLLALEKVSKNYGSHDVKALAEIDLTVNRGSFVALMGPSGCGKSTLLNIIGGIDRPSSGRVFLNGADLTALSDEQLTRVRGKDVGFIFQFFNLLSTLTVEENVLLPLDLAGSLPGAERKKRVKELLTMVRMDHRCQFYPSQLSGGEMQRTAVARALIHAPQLIVADEPTGNLDTENGQIVLDLLKTVNKQLQMTILMATHSNDAVRYADRVLKLKDGILIGESKQCSPA